jgi:DUF2914 family protein/tetratricopeptide repeat protein
MSELRSIREILAEAERAASTGDFLSAESLLRDAAVRQEAELGPVHPDLVNTVNNLAVAAEKSGRLEDAETFYRRAVAIASASLQPDDPKLAASRQNLEDFCRAHGRPIHRSQAIEPPANAPVLPPTSPPALQPDFPKALPPISPKRTRAPAALPIGVAGLVIFATAMAWLLSPRHPSTSVPAASHPPAKVDTPAPPARSVAPAERTPAATVARTQPAPPTTAGVQLVTVQLCRNFSTETFRCNPAADSVPAGTIVLYTRVRSPNDGVIVHRWFRGDALRKTSRLRIGANEAEGYRTYSQQSVDRGDWRVEVRSAAGDLLYEHRLTVR